MIKTLATAIAILTLATLSASPALAITATSIDTQITQTEVEAAQAAWGDALVQISNDYAEAGIDEARATAEAVIAAAYGYNLGPVLFKPTLAEAAQTFRTTAEGALAYSWAMTRHFPMIPVLR
jgi:hypothetical protein